MSLLDNEPRLRRRLPALREQFVQLYGKSEEVISRAPGRAEIIGNHTDYNNGYALAASISKNMVALFSKRADSEIHIYSNAFPAAAPYIFSMRAPWQRDVEHPWTNYSQGVVKQLLEEGFAIGGADILLDSNVPASGGVSSSAAMELAVAFGLVHLYGGTIDPLQAAALCQRAENLFVLSPCGFLDQASVAMGAYGHLVFFDFQPSGSAPVSEVSRIPIDLDGHEVTFVITVDPEVKRQLGATGYPARRKKCEDSVPVLARELKRPLTSLRDVSTTEFEQQRDFLGRHDDEIRKRVEHIVYENERVLAAVEALQRNDIRSFGALMTSSGESALHLYELDAHTPELTYLFDHGRQAPGVLGIRNMGGGFSAITIALVRDAELDRYQEHMRQGYASIYGRNLDFILFRATDGVGMLDLNELDIE